MGNFKALAAQVVGLCGSVFGDTVTYTPADGSPVSINGVFDNAWVETEGVQSLKPILRINLGDLDDAPAKGDAVEISGVDYSVTESRADGHGGSTLILRKI